MVDVGGVGDATSNVGKTALNLMTGWPEASLQPTMNSKRATNTCHTDALVMSPKANVNFSPVSSYARRLKVKSGGL